jgi:endonuclease IV
MPLGFHVGMIKSSSKTRMHDSIVNNVEFLSKYVNSRCVQIFVTGPRTSKENLTPEDKTAIRNLVATTSLAVVIHGAYIDNPWSGKGISVHNIKVEMRIAAEILATGVIIHLSNNTNNTLETILDKINEVEENVKNSVMLWLEINAVKSSADSFETPEKLIALINRVKNWQSKNNTLRIGLCIDTAHLHACGVSFESRTAVNSWLDAMPKDIPYMLHLNDSGSRCGSGKDLHAGLTLGNIWKRYHTENVAALPIEDSGLVAILMWAELNSVLVILERDTDALEGDLGMIRDLAFFD